MPPVDKDVLQEIQFHLIEDPNFGAFISSGLWSIPEIVEAFNDRQAQFLRDTFCQLRRVALPTIPNTQHHPVPQDWIATMRVAFKRSGADLNDKLVEFWNLDEALGNSIGAIQGTVLNPFGDPRGERGIIGGQRKFVRAKSQKLVVTDPLLFGADKSFSLAFAVTFASLPLPPPDPQPYQVCIGKKEDVLGYSCYLSGRPAQNSSFVFTADDVAPGFADAISTVQVTAGVPYFIVCRYDRENAVMSVSVNEVLTTGSCTSIKRTTTPAPNFVATNAQANRFSVSSRDAGDGYMDGSIDLVGYWQKILSSAEEDEYCNRGRGNKPPFLIPGSYYELPRTDVFDIDQHIPRWGTDQASRPKVFADGELGTLEVLTAPAASQVGTLGLGYVSRGTSPLEGTGQAFYLIPELVPGLKWGALADLLGKVGRGQDTIRAEYAEERYRTWVAAAKLLLAGFA